MVREMLGKYLTVSSRTIGTWIGDFRNICTQFLLHREKKSAFKLGGEGMVVQIDESNIRKSRKKCGVAKGIKDPLVWVVGVKGPIVNGGGRMGVALRLVDVRDKATLHKFIKDYVAPGSQVNSDAWKGYIGLDKMIGDDGIPMGYIHKVVVHAHQFKTPEGVHTNWIEGEWGNMKDWLKLGRGVDSKYISSYLDEWMFRRNLLLGMGPNEMFWKVLKLMKRFNPPLTKSDIDDSNSDTENNLTPNSTSSKREIDSD